MIGDLNTATDTLEHAAFSVTSAAAQPDGILALDLAASCIEIHADLRVT